MNQKTVLSRLDGPVRLVAVSWARRERCVPLCSVTLRSGLEVSKITHIKVLGLALFAVFAFSMVAAASAFAESEWLWQGLAIPAGQELLTDTEGLLTLLVLSLTGVVINTIDCSALFEGDVLPGGVDLVLDAWTLPPAQSLIEELEHLPPVIGKSLDCVTESGVTGLCLAGEETLLWVDELNLELGLVWETLIELDGAVFLDHFHNVAFELLCITAAGDLEALCSGLTSALLANVAEVGVLVEFSEAAGIESEELLCVDGTEEFHVAIDGNLVILHEGGGLLSVS